MTSAPGQPVPELPVLWDTWAGFSARWWLVALSALLVTNYFPTRLICSLSSFIEVVDTQGAQFGRCSLMGLARHSLVNPSPPSRSGTDESLWKLLLPAAGPSLPSRPLLSPPTPTPGNRQERTAFCVSASVTCPEVDGVIPAAHALSRPTPSLSVTVPKTVLVRVRNAWLLLPNAVLF